MAIETVNIVDLTPVRRKSAAHVPSLFDCDYCRLTTLEGATPVTVEDGFTTLCQHCVEDKVLGACGHHRTCDCGDGHC
jgi:hypothetical protein